MVNKKDTIKRTNSKGVLATFTPNKGRATVYPNYSLASVAELLDKEPVARGALNHFVSKCMEGPYAIVDKKTKKYNYLEELRLEEQYNFRTEILRKVFLLGKAFNNVFIEIVRTQVFDENSKPYEKTKALNVLYTPEYEPITKPNGDLIKLKSKIANPETGEYPEWDAKDIVWFKFGDRSQGYSPVDLKALHETLLMKSWVRRYVAWLWKTGQYRILYNPRSAGDADIEDFIAFLQKNDHDYQVPFIFKGELETKLLRDIKETESIQQLLEYLDSQILILLRVPPVDAGVTDASGRSSADQQNNNLITSISDFKKVVEDYISYKLFPKINKGPYQLRFGPSDRFAVKQAYEIVQIMKSLNMTEDACKAQLNDMGLYYDKDKIFEEPEVDPITAAAKNPRDKDMAPSRLGKGIGEKNQNQEEITTRDDQLKKE